MLSDSFASLCSYEDLIKPRVQWKGLRQKFKARNQTDINQSSFVIFQRANQHFAQLEEQLKKASF